jgi:hypothetical protein
MNRNKSTPTLTRAIHQKSNAILHKLYLFLEMLSASANIPKRITIVAIQYSL